MTTITVGRMVVETAGEGFPVVMVHGLGGTSNTFQPLLPALGGFRLVRPDLPGAGRSPLPQDEITIETLAATLIACARSLGIARAHFIGHSMGTILCQRLAADEPDLVASLTLFGAIIEPPPAARTGLIARARSARFEGMDGIADQVAEASLSASTRTGNPAAVAFVRESLMRQDAEGYARHCEALSKAEPVDSRRIGVPALLITGDGDPVAPASMAQMLADRITGARLSLLERCGHWPTIEKPVESNRMTRDFLKQLT